MKLGARAGAGAAAARLDVKAFLRIRGEEVYADLEYIGCIHGVAMGGGWMEPNFEHGGELLQVDASGRYKQDTRILPPIVKLEEGKIDIDVVLQSPSLPRCSFGARKRGEARRLTCR